MNLRILRVSTPSSSRPTFGVFYTQDGTPFAVTLERPWRNNERSVSCIPTGTYTCKRVDSPKFGDTFEVTNVVGRSHILFHKGNLQSDTHGCIIVGEQYEKLDGEPGVVQSGKGFAELLQITKDLNEFNLVVDQA